MGDFNAPHLASGYKYALVEGMTLCEVIQHYDLLLITDPMKPTRRGNNVSSDTTPVITLTHGGVEAMWWLGSDCNIIEIVVSNGTPVPQTRKHKITSWETLRSIDATNSKLIRAFGEWSKKILEAAQAATGEIETDEGIKTADSGLISFWRKKKGLEEKLKHT